MSYDTITDISLWSLGICVLVVPVLVFFHRSACGGGACLPNFCCDPGCAGDSLWRVPGIHIPGRRGIFASTPQFLVGWHPPIPAVHILRAGSTCFTASDGCQVCLS